MADQRLVRLSKLLSLILRHDPGQFGISLDPEGYASLQDVLRAVQGRIPDASESELIAVVNTIEPDKRRFTIDEDEIRANYGHSLTQRIDHERAMPPPTLWHGTTESATAAILRDGISPMKRQYVHLTISLDLARRIGARRGVPTILTVSALAAHLDGVAFYRANDSFWLADFVPTKYLSR